MRSLSARLLLVAGTVLVAFLGLTGLALDRAFRDSAEASARERLRAQIYMLLGAAEMASSGQVIMPDKLPDPRFALPSSGLYGQLVTGPGQIAWRSRSLVGTALAVGALPQPGAELFQRSATSIGTDVLSLSLTVTWDTLPGRSQRFTVQVAEDRQVLDGQVQGFRRSLWGWFAGAALVLLLVQTAILRWGLAPLRRVAIEVRDIETGHKGSLTGTYPSELQPLTRNLNALIASRNARLERYRNSLADLAHSMKTPLAVLRGATEQPLPEAELRGVLREQVTRLTQTVDYQLHRAAAAGRSALATPVAIAPIVQRIVQSLQKVHAAKNVSFDVDVDADIVFAGDEGDLFEIIGNLVDNACKWSRRNVRVRSRYLEPGAATRATRLVVTVEDDGPGLPEAGIETLVQRGVRADWTTEGQGIGLAVVNELVGAVYGGRLAASRSDLGGACFEVTL